MLSVGRVTEIRWSQTWQPESWGTPQPNSWSGSRHLYLQCPWLSGVCCSLHSRYGYIADLCMTLMWNFYTDNTSFILVGMIFFFYFASLSRSVRSHIQSSDPEPVNVTLRCQWTDKHRRINPGPPGLLSHVWIHMNIHTAALPWVQTEVYLDGKTLSGTDVELRLPSDIPRCILT